MWLDTVSSERFAKHVLAALIVCATSCTSSDEPAALPPPPANATASCVYRLVTTAEFFPDPDLPVSTLWLDASGQVIRVDGWRYGDSGRPREILTVYDLTWDAEQRLVAVHGGPDDRQFTYSTDQVVVTNPAGETVTTHHLVDGRDVREDSPPDPKTSQQAFIGRTYDAAGRLTSETYGSTDTLGMTDTATYTVAFTYDAKGRIASFQTRSIPDNGHSTSYVFSYTETSDRLVVDVIDAGDPHTPMIAQTWTFEFDAKQRLVRDVVDNDGDGYDDAWDDFRYLDGEIDVSARASDFTSSARAIGQCAAPSPVLAPAGPLPIPFLSVLPHRSLPNEAARALAYLGASGSLIPYPN